MQYLFVKLDIEHFQKVPTTNGTEVQRSATELDVSLPKDEEKPLQQRVRFSSSTSDGGGGNGEQVGSEIHCSSSTQVGHGDSGVEADLSALDLLDEDGVSDDLAKEIGDGTTECQESINFPGAKGQVTQESSGNAGQSGFRESPIQICQKRKGKSVKKEVMLSFGMVKCDSVRQEQLVKQKM